MLELQKDDAFQGGICICQRYSQQLASTGTQRQRRFEAAGVANLEDQCLSNRRNGKANINKNRFILIIFGIMTVVNKFMGTSIEAAAPHIAMRRNGLMTEKMFAFLSDSTALDMF